MKAILLLLFLIVPISSHASNWVKVATSNNGEVFLIDTESLSRSGDSVTFWGITNYGTKTPQGDLSAKVQRTIKCKTKDLIFRYYMFYDELNGNGKMTSASSAEAYSSWVPIAPDTMNDYLFKAVCRK